MKKITAFTCLLIVISMLCAAVAPTAYAADASQDEAYIASLTEKGFPADYAEKLLKLHKKHPAWVFEPLDVTGLSGGKYTWEYIMYQECEASVNRNLVSAGDSYITLRDMSNTTLYDSGWYRASEYAVAYMMDPRNFMDEKQIFQYYSLAWSDSVTVEAVEAVLEGTFMANAKLDGEYSNMTYAEYFMKTGKELGANPVFLASRIRNEQGTAGTSSLINGKCGDKLWYYYSNKVTGSEGGHLIAAPKSGYSESQLKAYNGYYNYFNIGASGTGYFQIYLGGMTEAREGTPSKSAEWGGSPSWNTRWKAIYGGALKAVNNYINDYQDTPYLQKFNVDPRSSRNFWGQYMQSIHGATSVASNFYTSFKDNKMLDLPFTFSIPVYQGIPEECPYPDGTEIADTSYILKDNVASYEVIDFSTLKSQKGYGSKWSSSKISWRVFIGAKDYTLDLGKQNLSKYDYALIEYSVSDKFVADACGEKSIIGFVTDPNQPYGGEGESINLTANISNKRMVDKTTGWLQKEIAYISLAGIDYIGNVYLTAYTQKSQKYVVHNVIFVTKTTHTGTIEETTAPQTDAPETSAPETSIFTTETEKNTEQQTSPVTQNVIQNNSGMKDTLILAGIIVTVIILAAVLTVMLVKKPKNKSDK